MNELSLSSTGLGLAGLALIASAIVSFLIDQSLARSIVWAGVRAFLQLSLVGLVLKWIFEQKQPAWMLGFILIMTFAATHAIQSRVKKTYSQNFLHCFVAIGSSSWLFTAYAVYWVIDTREQFSAQFILPLAGILLGNSLSGITLGVNHWFHELRYGTERIEHVLAHGATRWEAAQKVFREAVKTALTPTLNAMTIAGLVSLPGTMTGQLLAGADPMNAVKYQIAILFLLSGCTLAGVMTALVFSFFRVFNSRHQLDLNCEGEKR